MSGPSTTGNARAARERLPHRRLAETFVFECNGLRYLATISRYPDGRLAEIFISNAKAGSHSDSAAKDSAVVAYTHARSHGGRVVRAALGPRQRHSIPGRPHQILPTGRD
jgi:ribonucleoside-diphosphate reductase alpha chain